MLTLLTFGTLFKMRGGEIFFRESLIEKNELEKTNGYKNSGGD